MTFKTNREKKLKKTMINNLLIMAFLQKALPIGYRQNFFSSMKSETELALHRSRGRSHFIREVGFFNLDPFTDFQTHEVGNRSVRGFQ